jgi:hypothetical protein
LRCIATNPALRPPDPVIITAWRDRNGFYSGIRDGLANACDSPVIGRVRGLVLVVGSTWWLSADNREGFEQQVARVLHGHITVYKCPTR